MEKNIRLLIPISTCCLVVLVMLAGCESSAPVAEMPVTGFLSNYSGLEPLSDTVYRYTNLKYDIANHNRLEEVRGY